MQTLPEPGTATALDADGVVIHQGDVILKAVNGLEIEKRHVLNVYPDGRIQTVPVKPGRASVIHKTEKVLVDLGHRHGINQAESVSL